MLNPRHPLVEVRAHFFIPAHFRVQVCVLVDDTMKVVKSDCLIEMISAYSPAEVVVVLCSHFDDMAIKLDDSVAVL